MGACASTPVVDRELVDALKSAECSWLELDFEGRQTNLGAAIAAGRYGAPAPVPRPYVHPQCPRWQAAVAAALRSPSGRIDTLLSRYKTGSSWKKGEVVVVRFLGYVVKQHDGTGVGLRGWETTALFEGDAKPSLAAVVPLAAGAVDPRVGGTTDALHGDGLRTPERGVAVQDEPASQQQLSNSRLASVGPLMERNEFASTSSSGVLAGGPDGSRAASEDERAPTPGRTHSSDAAQPGLGMRILLVDDVNTIRRMGEAFLKTLGCTCVCLEDGDQVEAELEGSALPFDGILMDITMSRTDGVDVCRNLREKLGVRVPIIAMTGSASSVDKKRYYKQGFDVVLPKPFTLETMRQALQEASERRANARFAYRGGMPEISSSDFSPAPV